MRHAGTQEIETPRLLLRRLMPSDAPMMYSNWANDPEVTRWLRWTPHKDVAETQELLSAWALLYPNEDYYQWAIVEKATGQVIDPDSIFDCQVKRMHEYKRQHLNAMNIAAEYLYLKANPNADFVPKTYIFGAKAAPGYYMAKQMIRMICKLGKLIDNDPAVKDKLRIVYLEDYCVSLSERLMPASEVSEQISLAGTEASGTGNMKFMLNGAITLGTLDGANVEIADAAGKDNEIIFGMLTPEVNALKGMGYHPQAFISDDNVAMAVLDMLEKGWNGENFSEVTNNLRNSDPYMVLADFKDYRRAQHTVQELYKQKQTWNRMSLMNISNAGIFSADRSIMDYARDIWGATPVK